MKYAAAAVAALLSATTAAPTVGTLRARSPSASDLGFSASTGFIFPNVVSIHNVNTNDSTLATETNTARAGNSETTTLYQLPIPAAASGKTCQLVIYAGGISAGTDSVSGTGAVDIFNNNIADLADTATGDFRNNQLARVIFNAASGAFDFDTVDVTPKIQSFPCPAGKTLEWESVSVGTADQVVIQQDFSLSSAVPNGLTIAFY